MALALIVAVVGISAAWFADIKTASDTVIISSAKPSGQATIDVDSASTAYLGGDKLAPAVIKKNLVLNDRTGEGLNGVGFDQLNVLDQALVDASGSDASKPLLSSATMVQVIFPFIYIGGSDSGFSDGNKAVSIYLESSTLENPRSDGNGALADYTSDFTFENMSVINKPAEDGTTEENTSIEKVWTQEENELYLIIKPGVIYYFMGTIYINKIDEECNPILLDTTVFFNFEIAAVSRRA
jgi:hypothetical protein